MPDAKSLFVSGEDLTIDKVVAVAKHHVPVELTSEAVERIRVARSVVEKSAARGDVVYGLNTDLGPLTRRRISELDVEEFQVRTLMGHTVGFYSEEDTGKFFAELDVSTVRAMMLARVNGIAKGGAGVRLEVAEKLIELLNKGVHPLVISGSSVGQSDLSEMAQIAQVMIGLGNALYNGRRMSGAMALQLAGITPLRLASKEALALMSANGLTLGHGALILDQARQLMKALDLSAAMALEAFAGNLSIIHRAAARLKPHPGHIAVADHLRDLLAHSYLWGHEGARNLQDPLSFRCVPQVHGALHESIEQLCTSAQIELNSAADNPLVNITDHTLVSVGNFDITNIAIGFDSLRVALVAAINIANERVQKQMWSQFSGLPTGLEREGDPLSRMIPLARATAALAAEANLLAMPVSLTFRAQLAEGIEDHASAGPLAVQQTERLINVAQRLIALEMLVSTAAIALRQPERLGAGTQRAFQFICSGPWSKSTQWMVAVERILAALHSGDLISIVEAADQQDFIIRFVKGDPVESGIFCELGAPHPVHKTEIQEA